jgi:hypothetical protein
MGDLVGVVGGAKRGGGQGCGQGPSGGGGCGPGTSGGGGLNGEGVEDWSCCCGGWGQSPQVASPKSESSSMPSSEPEDKLADPDTLADPLAATDRSLLSDDPVLSESESSPPARG